MAFAVLATGCDLLPSDGPSSNAMLAHAAEIRKANPASVMRVAIVNLDGNVARDAEAHYRSAPMALPAEFQRPGSFGLLGVGDALKVTIWESGEVGLLAGRDRKGTEVNVRVDVDGTIALPYAGRFPVAGKRASEVEQTIVARLADQAVQPQATVVISDNISSSVSVQGEVNKPGPYPVAKTNQRVLDMIAMAGGTKYASHETSMRITRGRSTMVLPLTQVIDQPDPYNVPVAAGDSVLLSRNQQKFLAFGAVALPGEQAFRKPSLSMSDALGQVLGLDATRADAKGLYLFRREPVALAQRYGVQILPEDQGTVPIVYQVDLKAPQSFFLMNNFPVRPNDIVYVSAAPLSEAARFFQILSGATASVAIPRTLLGNYPSGN